MRKHNPAKLVCSHVHRLQNQGIHTRMFIATDCNPWWGIFGGVCTLQAWKFGPSQADGLNMFWAGVQ